MMERFFLEKNQILNLMSKFLEKRSVGTKWAAYFYIAVVRHHANEY